MKLIDLIHDVVQPDKLEELCIIKKNLATSQNDACGYILDFIKQKKKVRILDRITGV